MADTEGKSVARKNHRADEEKAMEEHGCGAITTLCARPHTRTLVAAATTTTMTLTRLSPPRFYPHLPLIHTP